MACNPLQAQHEKLKEAEHVAKKKQAESDLTSKDDNPVKTPPALLKLASNVTEVSRERPPSYTSKKSKNNWGRKFTG